MAVQWWGAFPSTLETHLLCRLEGEDQPWDARARWREHLLASLAGSDLRLIDFLWNDLELGMDMLLQRLAAFAADQGWRDAELRDWGATELIGRSLPIPLRRNWSPPAWMHSLWAHGAVCATLERGLELHSAALVVLGRVDQIKHRIWRGQAELLLPLIDHIRLTLCNVLTEAYGDGWPCRWREPESEKEKREVLEDPLACGLGHLELLLKVTALRAYQHWGPLVSRTRWIRNELAHYRTIPFADFEHLLKEVDTVLRPTLAL